MDACNLPKTACGPFYKYGLTLNPAWLYNYIHYNACDEITNPFLKTSMVQLLKFRNG